MKIVYFCTPLLLSSALFATTVNLSLDTGISFYGEDDNFLGAGDSVQVGYFSSWSYGDSLTDLVSMGFQEFDASANSYGAIGNGWLAGGGSMNGNAAAFNSKQIWVVLTDADGGFGVLSGVESSANWTFPTDGNGVNDTLNLVYGGAEITRISGLQAVPGGYQISPVPEPSTAAALAGLAALGTVMVRRRRR